MQISPNHKLDNTRTKEYGKDSLSYCRTVCTFCYKRKTFKCRYLEITNQIIKVLNMVFPIVKTVCTFSHKKKTFKCRFSYKKKTFKCRYLKITSQIIKVPKMVLQIVEHSKNCLANKKIKSLDLFINSYWGGHGISYWGDVPPTRMVWGGHVPCVPLWIDAHAHRGSILLFF